MRKSVIFRFVCYSDQSAIQISPLFRLVRYSDLSSFRISIMWLFFQRCPPCNPASLVVRLVKKVQHLMSLITSRVRNVLLGIRQVTAQTCLEPNASFVIGSNLKLELLTPPNQRRIQGFIVKKLFIKVMNLKVNLNGLNGLLQLVLLGLTIYVTEGSDFV